MARSIVSLGMLPALASEIALRKRAFASGSPPPVRAATVNSFMNLVKSFPRLASSAPFLCLIECHFECPDISNRILKSNYGLSFRCQIIAQVAITLVFHTQTAQQPEREAQDRRFSKAPGSPGKPYARLICRHYPRRRGPGRAVRVDTEARSGTSHDDREWF